MTYIKPPPRKDSGAYLDIPYTDTRPLSEVSITSIVEFYNYRPPSPAFLKTSTPPSSKRSSPAASPISRFGSASQYSDIQQNSPSTPPIPRRDRETSLQVSLHLHDSPTSLSSSPSRQTRPLLPSSALQSHPVSLTTSSYPSSDFLPIGYAPYDHHGLGSSSWPLQDPSPNPPSPPSSSSPPRARVQSLRNSYSTVTSASSYTSVSTASLDEGVGGEANGRLREMPVRWPKRLESLEGREGRLVSAFEFEVDDDEEDEDERERTGDVKGLVKRVFGRGRKKGGLFDGGGLAANGESRRGGRWWGRWGLGWLWKAGKKE
ncbi:MAG: hypothetical protein M1820_006668 [Bogoriella megaspora]|nr:MAG: hypothetical protein M1820_006668 [Bogoriella megaspora]